MNRAAAFCLAAACLLSAGPATQASNISSSEFSWGYRFEPSGHGTHIITNHNAVGFVSIPDSGHNNHMHTAAGATTDISTRIWAASTASASNPQTVDVPFTINLRLSDHASGLSGFVTFSGELEGKIWKGGSTLSPTFTSPLTQTVDIDHHLYTVKFESFTAPHGLDHPGKFVFDVSVQHNPEPSSLLLAGIGAPFFGLALRRRRRRAK
ncbi:MAG TPA: PEP-CTERM sorting domain-containing protein [Gemmataceae bacterium]|jgi:hypothetical protein